MEASREGVFDPWRWWSPRETCRESDLGERCSGVQGNPGHTFGDAEHVGAKLPQAGRRSHEEPTARTWTWIGPTLDGKSERATPAAGWARPGAVDPGAETNNGRPSWLRAWRMEFFETRLKALSLGSRSAGAVSRAAHPGTGRAGKSASEAALGQRGSSPPHRSHRPASIGIRPTSGTGPWEIRQVWGIGPVTSADPDPAAIALHPVPPETVTSASDSTCRR
jgi:hypothetical protein